jgi:ABC-2 type transport system ATP-binding protein
MIRAESLSKSYGPHVAVDALTFEVAEGEVVGFLGKNGAGKTTTLRMLAGSLAIGSGQAFIAGKNVSSHARAVKSMVGYLPEVPPLYPNMTVQTYLTFCARLRGVEGVKAAVDRVVGLAGLVEVRRRPIGNLSKGYKQRVGIAQSLVHSPRVLLLDEPVSGLDPTQRKDMRELIVSLSAGETTVLLSTHVLSEIEDICTRVIIVSDGRLVEDDTLSALSMAHGRVLLQVARPLASLRDGLLAIEGVSAVQETRPGVYELSVSQDVREQIAGLALPCGLIELKTPKVLEDLFARVTEGIP